MRTLFITDFSLDGNSGKNKATREKVNALSELVGDENLILLYPSKVDSLFRKFLDRIILDIRAAKVILSFDKTDIVVQRAVFLPIMLFVCKIKSIKVFAEYHADFKEEIKFLNKSLFEKQLLYLVSIFYNLNYRLVDGIIYNHPYLKDKFDNVFKKPSIYSYNGSNNQDFQPTDQMLSRETIGIPPDHFIYLFLGSVSQWHGVDLLIETFNEPSLLAHRNVFLYIVGAKNNEYTARLKSLSKNVNIVFVDPVDTALAATYINAADVCLLPVKHIRTSPGSPLKLYDYISCGKPVITQSDLHGYADEVIRYNLGFVTDFNSSFIAAADLSDIVKKDLGYYCNNNRYVALNKVSWKNRMEVWMKFFKNI